MKNINALIKKIKKDLSEQGYQTGDHAPTLRALGQSYQVCPETIRKALLQMCEEGTIKALPRRGYLLTKNFFEKTNTLPMAFVTNKSPDLSNAQNATWACSAAISHEAQIKGIPIISLHLGGLTPAMIQNQFSGLSLSGIIVDSREKEFVHELLNTKLPVVSVNSWIDMLPYNSIVQDNYYGSFKAVHFLHQLGYSKIAWLSIKDPFNHIRERYSGYRDALEQLEIAVPQEYHIKNDVEHIEKQLINILKSNNRPNALLAFGPKMAQISLNAIRECKLTLGKDIHIVGWSVEENKQAEYLQYFDQSYQPFMVTWKAKDMAKAAIEQIIKLQDQPNILQRINIPTSIERQDNA